MDTGRHILPIPLWVEYNRIKKTISSKLESQRDCNPTADYGRRDSHTCSINDRSTEIDELAARLEASRHLSISLSSNQSSEDLRSTASPLSEKPPLHPSKASKGSSPLKQSILSLKKSVNTLKLNSVDLYKSMSVASTNFSSTYSSPTSLRSDLLKLGTPSCSPFVLPTETSRLINLTEEKSTQVESSGFSSFPSSDQSRLPPKHRFVYTPTPSIPEADLSETDSFVGIQRGSSPPPVRTERNVQQASFSTPNKVGKLKLLRKSEGGDVKIEKEKRESGENRKGGFYYMKALSVGGKLYSWDEAGVELRMGKMASQAITLTGTSTSGGFHLFSSPESLLASSPACSSHPPGRLCVLQVHASGSSFRYVLLSASPDEIVFSSVIPLEVVSRLQPAAGRAKTRQMK